MKTEQELQQQLDKLPTEIAPQRDLWPQLAARLAQLPQQSAASGSVDSTPASTFKRATKVTHRSWWLAAAAAVLFTVWAPWQQGNNPQYASQSDMLNGMKVGHNIQPQTTFDQGAVITDYRPIKSAYLSHAYSETLWRLNNDFEQQRAMQLAQIKQVPEFYQDWKQQLKIWQQATKLVQLALHYQPDEPGLLRKLAKLQQQELAYLQKVVQADQT